MWGWVDFTAFLFCHGRQHWSTGSLEAFVLILLILFCWLFQRPWWNVDWAFEDHVALEREKKKIWKSCLVNNVIYTRSHTHIHTLSRSARLPKTASYKASQQKERQLEEKGREEDRERKEKRREAGQRLEAERERVSGNCMPSFVKHQGWNIAFLIRWLCC